MLKKKSNTPNTPKEQKRWSIDQVFSPLSSLNYKNSATRDRSNSSVSGKIKSQFQFRSGNLDHSMVTQDQFSSSHVGLSPLNTNTRTHVAMTTAADTQTNINRESIIPSTHPSQNYNSSIKSNNSHNNSNNIIDINSRDNRNISNNMNNTLSQSSHAHQNIGSSNNNRNSTLLPQAHYQSTNPPNAPMEVHNNSPWILPPIPSFSDLSLRFDRSRTSSSSIRSSNNSTQNNYQQNSNLDTSINNSSSRINMDEQGYHWNSLNTPRNITSNTPTIIPNHLPSIFDDIQTDDDESYIIWSTTTPVKKPTTTTAVEQTPSATHNSSTPKPANLGPAQFSESSSSAIFTPSPNPIHSSSMPPLGPPQSPPVQESSSTKRWSARETFKAGATSIGSSKPPMPTKMDSTAEAAASNTGNSSLQPSKRIPQPQSGNDPNRVIMAATVEKLVEKLTSEIDYTFLTDFFLIYRQFISPMELLNLFILRFHWALVDDSPQRLIVRIRTFVTLRHWILNYFGYDFMRSKELRQRLNLHFRSLSKHPIVVASQRDQRIIRELRRYAQSLKKIHYRNLAQRRLEKQARKLGERQNRKLQERGTLSRSYRECSIDHSEFHTSGMESQHPTSSRRSSAGPQDILNSASNVSEPFTEELTIEFRSSEHSEDDEDSESDSDDSVEFDNEYELSSESSSYDSEEDSDYSASEDEGPRRDYSTDDRDMNDQREDKGDSELSDMSSSQEDLRHTPRNATFSRENYLPSPAFSPRSQKSPQGGSGSCRSQQFTQSVVSSAASRTRARGRRPPLPDFGGVDKASAINLDPPSPSFFNSAESSRRSKVKTGSRPLSAIISGIPPPHPPQSGPRLSNRSSIRSIEPYINPPPRSIQSSEKKKTWSKYMTATVGRLSKVKNVFSNSKRGHRHSHSSSSILSGASASKKAINAINQSNSARHWQGNRSDPEGDKLTHYLLGSCTGMGMLLSSSEDRYLPAGRRFISERNLQREDIGSDWSSDDEYSQYEMTRRSSRQMQSNEESVQEDHDPIDSQLLEVSLEQAQYPPYIRVSSKHANSACYGHEHTDYEYETEPMVCPECERERVQSGLLATQLPRRRTEGNIAPIPGAKVSEDPIRERNLYRTGPKNNNTHRSSWVSLSSSGNSSVFDAPLSVSSHLPSQAIRKQKSHGNIDQLTESLYKQQQELRRSFVARRSSVLRNAAKSQVDAKTPSSNIEAIVIAPAAVYQSKRFAASSILLNHQPYPIEHPLEPRAKDDQYLPRNSSSKQKQKDIWGHDGGDFRKPLIRSNHNISSHEVSLHPLQSEVEATGSRSPIPTADTSAAVESLSVASPLVSSVEQSASEGSTNNQPQSLTLIKPALSKGRSKSHPHLLSSFSDPEISLLSIKSPEQSKRGPTLNTNGRCPHVQVSHAAHPKTGYSSITSRPLISRTSSYFHERDRQQARMDEYPRIHPLEPSNFALKEQKSLPLVLRYRSELIAQQLCLIEKELLFKVQWHELIDAGWNKKANPVDASKTASNVATDPTDDGRGVGSKRAEHETSTAKFNEVDSSPNRRHKAREESPGIKKLVARFNLTCQWVASEIVRTKDLDIRVKVVEKFIRVAYTCYNHSNFSSLIQVMLGLQAPAVERLSQTWDRVKPQEMGIMRDLVEFTLPLRNWKHIRDAMNNIVNEWGGNGNESIPSSPPPTEKQNTGAGVSFFGRRPSKSMAGAFASIATSRRPSASQPSEANITTTTITPTSFFASLQATSKVSSPLSPSTPPANAKCNKAKEKGGKQGGGCIPFLGLFLSDLVYNSELPSFIDSITHSSTTLESSHASGGRMLINIHKHRTTATIIKRVLAFRTMTARYPFQEEPEVHNLLMAIDGLDTQELLHLSYQCEVRASHA
ncbi:hypothetical protein BGZ76_010032 [Entomortierella beljakovae]|nr:hypothetical protein BGZ76_010032 [Entomortierella beljakovae]